MADDVFQRVDELDEASVGKIVERLEFRGTNPAFVAMREAYFDAVGLAGVERAIEIGCGTGVVARALARRPEFCGELHATDLTAAFIVAAAELAEREGLEGRIAFSLGDSAAITPVAGGYDLVIAHTLLSHVADPGAVIAAAAQALRPGGRLAVFDADFASMVVGTSGDDELDRTIGEQFLEVACANPRVQRVMPRLLVAAGLGLDTVQQHVYAEVGHSTFFAGLAEFAVSMLAANPAVDPSVAQRWLDGCRRANDEGVYFGCGNYYTYLATKPFI